MLLTVVNSSRLLLGQEVEVGRWRYLSLRYLCHLLSSVQSPLSASLSLTLVQPTLSHSAGPTLCNVLSRPLVSADCGPGRPAAAATGTAAAGTGRAALPLSLPAARPPRHSRCSKHSPGPGLTTTPAINSNPCSRAIFQLTFNATVLQKSEHTIRKQLILKLWFIII